MKIHKKLLIMALSLILCLAASIGFAAAYFTDYENARGGAIIRLTGQTELNESVDENGKTVTIKNIDEADMVVRVMFIADSKHFDPADVTMGNGWSGPDGDGWYYYNHVLKGSKDGNGDSTTDLKAVVKVKGDEDVKDFDVVVVHEAERVLYDGDTVIVPDGWNTASISAD